MTLLWEVERVGLSIATGLPSIDFETYSEAGYTWTGDRWASLRKGKPGLKGVGAWIYSRHHSTRVTRAAYDLLDGAGLRCWYPGERMPSDLADHVFARGVLGAFNSFFEYSIWLNVCERRYNWAPIELDQWRDTAAKCRAWTLPGKLETAAAAVGSTPKDLTGELVMRRLSTPRKPSANNPRINVQPFDDLPAYHKLAAYNDDDVRAEHDVGLRVPDLSGGELEVWKVDQAINARGVRMDRAGVQACATIIRQALAKYNREIVELTDGDVPTADSHDKLKAWMGRQGVRTYSTDKEAVAELLAPEWRRTIGHQDEGTGDGWAPLEMPLPGVVREVLERRQLLGHASVKKVPTMLAMMDIDDRIRGLFTYAGASRTWRWAGSDVQPQNLVASMDAAAAAIALSDIMTGSLEWVERRHQGNALEAVAGVLRSLFIAADGRELVSSDFSSIEAMVLAELSGEDWRRQVFRTHGKIYEASAAKMGGATFNEMIEHRERTGQHHPLRKLGKLAELASGYGGWVGAWERFGASAWLESGEIEDAIKAWRAASPAITAFWRSTEAAALAALDNPRRWFPAGPVSYGVFGNVLYCWLPSGRAIPYQSPRIVMGERFGRPNREIHYLGVDSQTGLQHWMKTYGGKLVENIVQAVARDIMAAAMVRIERAGYPIVLHVHDEPVAEVPVGWGSIEELESLMVVPLKWCADWPIRAVGGWRGLRFRKDG